MSEKKSQTQGYADIIKGEKEEPKELKELKPNKVLITINGGVAHLIEKPLGVEVEIRDYDVEGIGAEDDERCKKDKDGVWY